MSIDGLLQTLAQLFIALVGFTGIVAVIGRRGQGEWDPLERARLDSLLWSSVGGVLFTLAPLLAAAAHVEPTLAWRAGNGIVAVVHVYGVFRFLHAIGREHWLGTGPERIITVLVPIPAALILAQLAAALGWLAELGPFVYAGTLLWVLFVGMLQFIFLLIRPTGS